MSLTSNSRYVPPYWAAAGSSVVQPLGQTNGSASAIEKAAAAARAKRVFFILPPWGFRSVARTGRARAGKSACRPVVTASVRFTSRCMCGMVPDGPEPYKWTALIDFPLPEIYHRPAAGSTPGAASETQNRAERAQAGSPLRQVGISEYTDIGESSHFFPADQ